MTMKCCRRLLNAAAAALLASLAAGAGQAGTLSLADTPLFLGSAVKPNLIMAIDDSGSMDFELLLAANDGAAWWRTANASGTCTADSGNSFIGCTADGTTDLPGTNKLNFNNAGGASATWRKFAYLFPNGANGSKTSDQRRGADSTYDHYAIPPLPAYAWSRSPQTNHAYFNPSVTYNAWPSGGGLTLSDATVTATRYDPVYNTSGATIDLTQDFAGTASVDTTASCDDKSLPTPADNYYFRFYVGMTIPAGTCFYPTSATSVSSGGRASTSGVQGQWQTATVSCVVGSTNNSCTSPASTALGTGGFNIPNDTSVAIRYFPATFYLPATTSLPTGFGYTGSTVTGTAVDGSTLNGYVIKPGNFASTAQYNAAIQNFANWFQYYRKRHQALRGGLGAAFLSINNTRVAGFTINTSGSPTSPDVTMQDIDVAANRTALYSQFYQNWTGSGGTPNRAALANVVRNYKRPATDKSAPIQYACQQNFGMLFTDGFANPLATGDGFDTVGNVDGNYKAPYNDGTSNTMADGIMGAYVNNLRTDLTQHKVPVPAACSVTPHAASLDCNDNPHMNFFAITLGTRGLIFNPDSPVDPYTASPAIVWPSSTQLSQARNPAAVDDLWHATVNGRGALLNADSPADVADKLTSVLASIAARVGAAASVAVNGGSISANSRVYQSSFNSSTWTGDLASFALGSNGTLNSTNSWSAANMMPAPTSRKIFTVDGTGAVVPFEWDSLGATRQAQLQQNGTSVADTTAVGMARVAYLRGDHSQEQKNGGAFRNRDTALGDIIDSAPVYVGIPNYRYSDSLESVAYSKFQSDQLNRPAAVYVGGNDGMLHAFSAATGAEYFAFIPSGVFGNLYRLTQPTYAHKYFVDGSPWATDVFYNNSWHTVLTSGLNGGGQSIFALEVTRPDGYTETGKTTPFLWEFTDANDADLGETFSRPVVVRLKTGRWAAIFGNGYNNTVADSHPSSTGDAVLYVVDVENGTLIKKFDTGSGVAQDPTGNAHPNGLSTPTVIDADSDGIADYVYAGDLFGNIWKFNIGDASVGNWKIAYSGQPLFKALLSKTQPQPITTQPKVARGPNGQGFIVLFGTGKYLEASDNVLSNLITESFYGIIDKNTGEAKTDLVSGRDALTQQTIVFEGPQTYKKPDGTTITYNLRVVSNNPLGSTSGWYLDLKSPVNGFEGEMDVTDALIDGSTIWFTTLIPNADPCSSGGRSWLMALNLQTGSRLDTTPFDLNVDGSFGSKDAIPLPDGTKAAPSGMQLDAIGSTPTVLSTNATPTTCPTGNQCNTGGSNCDELFENLSNGALQELCKNPGPRVVGRQSWRQAH